MKIELTPKEFRRLLDLVYIGNWVLNSTRGEDRIKDFNIVENGLTAEEAQQESSRCLHCDHFGYGAFRGGRVWQW